MLVLVPEVVFRISNTNFAQPKAIARHTNINIRFVASSWRIRSRWTLSWDVSTRTSCSLRFKSNPVSCAVNSFAGAMRGAS